ncbi:MAG TPA: M36 family metallopeptidase, partial [Polyangia bacterium]
MRGARLFVVAITAGVVWGCAAPGGPATGPAAPDGARPATGMARPPALPPGPPSFDALDDSLIAPAAALGASPLVSFGADLHVDTRVGQPAFLWASAAGALAARPQGLAPVAAAQRHLQLYAPLYRLTPADVATARLHRVHDTGRGAVIVTFRQEVDGLEVFRRWLSVVMAPDRSLVAVAGNLAPAAAAPAPGFALAPADAVARAIGDLGGAPIDPGTLAGAADLGDGHSYFDLTRPPADLALRRAGGEPRCCLTRPARLKPVLFDRGDRLEPAFYVELHLAPPASVDSLGYSYAISAVDGRVLFRRNLTATDFTYRVYADATAPFMPWDGPQGDGATPHPTGTRDGYQAPLLAPTDITLQNFPFSRNDPWLPAGATTTLGNNVDAYVDLAAPDGFSGGDFRASTTAAGAFLRTYDPLTAPTSSTQRQAALTHLFFLMNFLHDWYYDAGFDEAAGNAQASNFGRGGLQNDRLLAEGQDYSGRDNANMTTPADGSSPVMQMYVWSGNPPRYLDVVAPAAIAGRKAVGVADFGPQVFTLTQDVVQAQPADACANLVNGAAVTGKIALIDRGTCTFQDKVWAAQRSGAVGALIVNTADETIDMATSGNHTVTIPTLLIKSSDGDAIKAQLAAPATVTVTMVRQAGTDRDGAVDTTVVAHEWGHYISNRLIGNANGLNNTQGSGMGEGWGDFHALLLTVKAADAAVPANADWAGVYAMAGWLSSGAGNDGGPNQGYYFGIRRVPYSTDFTKNALTFQHISANVPLPAGVPTAFGADGVDNAEVHNTGEVWATMLWECYAGLLRESGRLTFDEARERMKEYLVAAYKATPVNPTFVEARDALLAVAQARDIADCRTFGAAFARRGIGAGAVAPARLSTTNAGVGESYTQACVNRAPVANAGAAQTVDERTLVGLNGSASADPDGDSLTYAWNQTGGPAVTLTGPATATPSFTAPDVAVAGATLTFRLIVTDALGLASAAATTTVTVRNVNRAPTANAGAAQTVDELTLVTLSGGASSDPDGDALTFAWTQTGGAAVTLTGPTTAAPTFTAPAVGAAGTTLTFALVVTDALGLASAPAPVTVTVRNVNHAPTANAGAAQTVDELALVTLSGAASTDPDGDALTYAWTQTGGAAVTLTGPTTAAPTFTAPAVGAAGTTLTFALVVTDALGLASAPAPVTITVRNVNHAPTANAGATQTVDELTAVALSGAASTDPDGDALTYAWTQTGGPAVTLTGATTAAPTFTAPAVGAAGDTLTFALIVTDALGLASAPAPVTITVRNVNHA